MFARLNFLLALGVLILIGFYFAGVYLIVGLLSAVSPAWARFAGGGAVLLAVGFTVQLLAVAIDALNGVATYDAAARPGPAAFASQGALLLGHAGLLYAAIGLLRGEPASQPELAAIAGLYVLGIGIAIGEWKRRKRRITAS